jgi:hypothetical protein
MNSPMPWEPATLFMNLSSFTMTASEEWTARSQATLEGRHKALLTVTKEAERRLLRITAAYRYFPSRRHFR